MSAISPVSDKYFGTVTTAEILKAIDTAERIASLVSAGEFQHAEREWKRESFRKPLVEAFNEHFQPAERHRLLGDLLRISGAAIARPKIEHGAAILDYCRAIRQHMGTVAVNETKKHASRRKPGDLNGAMLNLIMQRPESRGWSSRKWARELHAQPSQITDQPAWKELEQFRSLQRIERQKSKRQGRAAK